MAGLTVLMEMWTAPVLPRQARHHREEMSAQRRSRRDRQGTAVVPPDLPRRESKDNRMHACMRAVWLNAAGPTTEVTCFFVPPTM